MSVIVKDVNMPKSCADCIFSTSLDDGFYATCWAVENHPNVAFLVRDHLKPGWCPLVAYNPKIETNIYDKETTIHNCTVQILENTGTGEISVGWKRNKEELE